jgi:rubrerythrin
VQRKLLVGIAADQKILSHIASCLMGVFRLVEKPITRHHSMRICGNQGPSRDAAGVECICHIVNNANRYHLSYIIGLFMDRISLKATLLALQVQRSIDQLDSQTRENYEAYTAALRQAELVEAYNRQLARMVEDQSRELDDIEAQLMSLAQTEQATLPLLVRMQNMLEQFVAADLPFLVDERQQRIERLARLMDRADVSLAEKYRQILEAYQIEAEYGRTLEAWTGTLAQDGQTRSGETREVTFLRLGRVALYYQTLDGEESGRWSRQQGGWQTLAADQNWPIRKGISMARQQTVPELLELPIELSANESAADQKGAES